MAAVVGLPGWEFATCRIGNLQGPLACAVLLPSQLFLALTPKDAFVDACALQSEAREMVRAVILPGRVRPGSVPSRHSSFRPLLFLFFFQCWKSVKACEWCGGTNTTLRSRPAAVRQGT